MKKKSKNQIENIKTGIIILFGIIIVIGLIFIVSNNTGDTTYQSGGSGSTNSQSSGTSLESADENPLLEAGEEITEDEQGELNDISYRDLESMLSNKEKKIIFLGSEYCGWCIYQKPILKYIVKQYNIEISYLNLGNVSQEEGSKLAGLHESLVSFGTPCFLVLENGSVTVVEQGARGTTAMIDFLKANGFISE